MPTVVLFDIDGTLLNAHGAGRRAMEAGFLAATGRALASFRFAGMTDPAIAREGLRAAGLLQDGGPSGDRIHAQVQSIIAAYLERLPAQLLARAPQVLPGVPERLDELSVHSGVAVGWGPVT